MWRRFTAAVAVHYHATMLLPERLLRLKPSFVWKSCIGGGLSIVAGLAMAAGVIWWQIGEAHRLLEEKALWASGVAAEAVGVSGQETTNKFIFHSYKLDVTFRDGEGRRCGGEVEFDTVGGSVEGGREAEVRYARGDSGRFVLSWALEVESSRWGAITIFVAVGGGFGALLIAVGIGALRKLADAGRCAVRGEEVVAQLTKVVQHTTHGKHTSTAYHFKGTLADGRTVAGKVEFPAKHQPLVLDPQGASILVLATSDLPSRPVALRSDCHPYSITEAKLAIVERVIEGLRNPASAQR